MARALSADSRVGTELAGYRIDAALGRGGMGVVYLGRDLRLKRRVALKLIAAEVAAEPRFRERFLREMEFAASLDHSHVVPVYEAGESGRELYLAMRYVEGEDLASLLAREGPLEPQRALELVSQVGEALDAAHAHGVVHRDVKPANVLVADEIGREHCYLTDFGLSAAAAGMLPAESPRLSGSVDYVAPEQIAEQATGERADVYSLGCVLYECLAGQPPFRRPRTVATLFAHLHDAPPSLHERRPELRAAIDQVIARALAKEAEERYASCRELCDDARRALGLTGPRFSRRKLLLAAGAGVALAAATAAPTVVFTRGGTPASLLPLSGDSLVRIEPATGRLAAAAPAEGAKWVGVTAGSVWFADPVAKRLARIDPEQGVAIDTFDISRVPHPDVFEAGDGAIWITQDRNTAYLETWPGGTALWRFTARTASLEASPPAVTRALGPYGVWDMAAGRGALWIVNGWAAHPRSAIRQIDSATGRIAATIPAGATIARAADLLAFGEGALWALDAASLRRINPITNRVIARIAVDLDYLFSQYSFPLDRAELVAGEGALWLLSKDDESVSRIDLSSGRITDRVRVGRIPKGIAVGEGAVWVGNARDGTVTRIDPRTLDVKTIEVGGSPAAITTGAGAVWTAVDVQ